MCCCRTPIAWVWNSQAGGVVHGGRNQHGFIAWKHSLTERNNTPSFIGNADVVGRCLAVWFIWEWLLDIAVVVTVQSAILFLLVEILPIVE